MWPQVSLAISLSLDSVTARRIAAEQREAERRRREALEEERAIAITKRKFKQEAAEVLLGVSALGSGI